MAELATVAWIFVALRLAVPAWFVYPHVIVGVPAPVAALISHASNTPSPFVDPATSRAGHVGVVLFWALVLVMVYPPLCQRRSSSSRHPACVAAPDRRARYAFPLPGSAW